MPVRFPLRARPVELRPRLRRQSLPAFLCAILLTAACGPESTAPTDAPATNLMPPSDSAPVQPANPLTEELLPEAFEWLWRPWTGDLSGIVERRALRVLLPYGGYQFYFDNGRPRGATFEMLRRLEKHLNSELGNRHLRVYVVPIPVSRDQLIPGLLAGHGDLIATDLTVTPRRSQLVRFLRPLLTGIDEVVVLGPTAAPVNSLEDLAGRDVFVRPTSSYAENLEAIAIDFERRGLEPPHIRPADEILEAEDILDMLSVGAEELTIMDEYKAKFWAEAIDGIVVRDDVVTHEDGKIAWAVRKDDTELAEFVDAFLKKYGKGSAFGNDVYRRNLAKPEAARCARSAESFDDVRHIVSLFREFGGRYDINWMMLAAQGFQESGLRQSRRSAAGAVGIMQIKPSTAADPNVGIDDVSTAENNIHAGTKYMRFLADRYFSDDDMRDIDRWLFSLAAYNAGPSRVAKLRREAAEEGLDPDRWFRNVEIVAARRIGRETVNYVSNVYRLFVVYELTLQRGMVFNERYSDLLSHCEPVAP